LPGEQNTPDARKHMEQRLAAARASGSSSGLLPALEALVQARNAAPAAVMQALSFHNGSVDLKVAAPDAASLDRMSQALRSNGWQADLTSGNNVASGYEGRIQIHSNGS
jgi:type II secretory pathway component PulL